MISQSAWAKRLRHPVYLLLAAAVVCSGGILLALGSRLTFFNDDWEFLIYRRGFSAGPFLDPHNQHIVLIPVAVYKLLLSIFGMSSSMPFRIVSTSVFLLSAVLLFILLRRRVGDVLALLGAVLILFLGPASEDLLWPFQIGFSGSIAAGLGMLLALERDDQVGDRLACLLLAISIAFSSLGLAFAFGALADLVLSPRARARRLYIAVVPLALYAVWWLGWGHKAESALSLHNLATMPSYVLDAVSAALTSLLGLSTPLAGTTSADPLGWGNVLVVVAVGLAGVRIHRLGRVPRGLWIVLAIGTAFWVLAGLNLTTGRGPTASRYQYPSGVFVLLIAGELLRGVQVSRRAIVATTAVAAAAVLSNGAALHDSYKTLFKPDSDTVRANQAAIEIAQDTVDPALVPSQTVAGTLYYFVAAGPYLSAEKAFGSPAYTPTELASSPEPDRAVADRVLATALRISLTPLNSATPNAIAAGAANPSGPTGRRCRTVQASLIGETGLRLRPGGFTLTDRASAPVEVLLGRFADELTVDLGPLQPLRSASLAIPADRSSRPWRLGLRGTGPVVVCRNGAA